MSSRLIILPKKNWHVWSHENMEKVDRDEAEFKQKQDREKERYRLAEQESRYETLKRRKRSDERGSMVGELNLDPERQEEESISLMDPLERKRSREKIEREKKEEESRGLGVGSIEHSGAKPWYMDTNLYSSLSTGGLSSETPNFLHQASSSRSGQAPNVSFASISSHRPPKNMDDEFVKFLYSCAKKTLHRVRLDRRKKEKRSARSSRSERKQEKQEKKIEKLRRERLLRERLEHSRINDLLSHPNSESLQLAIDAGMIL